jgi:hypothetical protein
MNKQIFQNLISSIKLIKKNIVKPLNIKPTNNDLIQNKYKCTQCTNTKWNNICCFTQCQSYNFIINV